MAVRKTVSETTDAMKNAVAGSSGMLPGTNRGASQAGAPRRVKTLIVRPDGTILKPAGADGTPSVDAAAVNMAVGPAINAAAIPRAKVSPGSGESRIRRMKTVGESSVARRINNASGSTVSRAVSRPRSGSVMKKMRTVKAVPVKPAAPAPLARMARKKPAPRPAVAGDIGRPYVVQVTSRSSQTGALAAFADMQQKYPSLIGSYSPDIQRADLGAKGVWYRLRVGPVGSKTAANDLCASLKQAGHPGCFVRRK